MPALNTKNELLTKLAEVEAVINNCPIIFTYEMPIDTPLTPNPMLYGRTMNFKAIKDDLIECNLNTRSTFIESELNHYWKRWREEYITELREYHKHKKRDSAIQITLNDTVLIHDPNAKRRLWKTGIVQKLIKSHDKQIRAAEVSNRKPIVIERPISKLYLLEASYKTLDA